ncbi:hypothetical protein [Bradyrhizobium sp. B117]|uniref:hypothetical protein n=1 Tax=Bradyrhizobium sp. B117 TaxID=3140246 RepID=UPI003182BD7B
MENERRAGVFGQDAEGIFLGIPNVNDCAGLLRGLQVSVEAAYWADFKAGLSAE